MKKIFFILIISFYTISAVSQNWKPLGHGLGAGVRAMYADTVDNYLYATGAFLDTTADGRVLKGIARWDGTKWDSLGTGIEGADPFALDNTFAFSRYKNKLYIGGVFSSLGDKQAKGLGTWDGTNWDTLKVQPFKKTTYNYNVVSTAIINNELYFGGFFDSINNIPSRSFGKWNDTILTPIGVPAALLGEVMIGTICEYKGYIYVGGNFGTALFPHDTIQCIMRYDGANWSSVGGGMKGGTTTVFSMVVYNNELYVAGNFNRSSGNVGDEIQKWDGTTWSGVGGGIAGGYLTKLLVGKDNKLYALGGFDHAGGIPANMVATWDGTNWCSLSGNFDNILETGCFYHDSLAIGGGFHIIDGDTMNFISRWIGGAYLDTCGHLTTGINEIQINSESLKIYPNPATNQITIDFDLLETKNTFIEIKNVLGQTVKTFSNNAVQKGSNKIEVDISEYSNGIYFVQLQNGNQITNQKFIKQ